jgi:cytochrome c oxidase subunit I+III
MLDERLSRWAFWLVFVSFNITFFPLHELGFRGMPRRVYTYLPDLGWDTLNLVSTLGSYVLGLGFALFAFNAIWSRYRGEPAPDDPWGGDTLEWATTSPPQQYNFAVLPVVQSRYPLWTRDGTTMPGIEGLEMFDPDDPRRETLGTTIMDAEPQFRRPLPGPSLWPLALALGLAVAVIGSMIDLVLVPFGAVLAFIAMVGWLRPPRPEEAP